MRNTVCLTLSLCAAATAQTVTEIPAMTVSNSVIDMDTVGAAGNTTEAYVIAAAATGCGASLREIKFTPSAAAAGVYNTNPGQGRALGRDTVTNALLLVDPPTGAFGAFDAEIHFAMQCTEFGMSIGDWNGPMFIDFYSGGLPVVTAFPTSAYSATAILKYFQMTGGTFDQVNIRASTTAGNWVIPDLVVEVPATGFTPFGRGCAGAGGEPDLAEGAGSSQRIGMTTIASVTNLPAGSGGGAMVIGTQGRQLFPGVDLPFDLAIIGAPGCLLWTDLTVVIPVTYGGGAFGFSVPIPNLPSLVGASVYMQAAIGDASAPAFFTVSNAAQICIQP